MESLYDFILTLVIALSFDDLKEYDFELVVSS